MAAADSHRVSPLPLSQRAAVDHRLLPQMQNIHQASRGRDCPESGFKRRGEASSPRRCSRSPTGAVVRLEHQVPASGEGGQPFCGQSQALAARVVIPTEAFGRLPKKLRSLCDGLIIRVEEFPTQEVLEDKKLQSDIDIIGLFHGVGLPLQSESNP